MNSHSTQIVETNLAGRQTVSGVQNQSLLHTEDDPHSAGCHLERRMEICLLDVSTHNMLTLMCNLYVYGHLCWKGPVRWEEGLKEKVIRGESKVHRH